MTSIDLTNEYFHIPILPHQKKYLHFAVGGQSCQYCCLPFRYSVAPCTYSKCVEEALTPLRERGMRILTYIDDCLILAASRPEVESHTVLVIQHITQLGFTINPSKRGLQPSQQIPCLRLLLDTHARTTQLSEELVEAILQLTILPDRSL